MWLVKMKGPTACLPVDTGQVRVYLSWNTLVIAVVALLHNLQAGLLSCRWPGAGRRTPSDCLANLRRRFLGGSRWRMSRPVQWRPRRRFG